MSQRKPLYGVGINDADYNVSVNKRVNDKMITIWRCPYYNKWTYMLKRCYSNYGYLDCSVCEEWLYFSNFKKWMEQQEWEGKELDKDLYRGSLNHYSPDNCTFLSRDVNCFVLLRSKFRGEFPVGVCYDNSRRLYQSHCNIIEKGERKSKNLGRFKDPLTAHRAWQTAKRDQAIYLQSQQTCERTIKGLQRIIDKLQYHLDNNIETKDL